MAGGGGEGNTWIGMLVGGGIGVGIGTWLHKTHTGPTWLIATVLAIGGLLVVFGSCEAMIKSVEGLGQRLGWNTFVAGTMAGLASNVPELVMLGFVVAADPRVAFIVVALTLHIGALSFGVYAGMLPRDATGHASLPTPLVKLSTDLYACAASFFLGVGALMLAMQAFLQEAKQKELSAMDLYVLGATLIFVEVVAIARLVKRFSGDEGDAASDSAAAPEPPPERDASAAELPSWGAIAAYGALGIGTSVVGGHAVGDFADILVQGLTAAGYSEMVGAILIAFFAISGGLVMMLMSHRKGLYDVALAGASGAVTQVPFVVMPVTLILIGVLSQLGVTPALEGGGALIVDLETTSVMLLAFPPLLILWKSVQDDGTVNWVETASMVAIFGLTVYLLAVHG
jgi:hypothetical protein